MVEDTRIRKADISDIPVIINLANAIWPVCFKDVIEPDLITELLNSIYSETGLNKEMKELGHIFWLASVAGNDVGYISAYVDDSTLWLKKLYILPAMQGRGIATRLMDAALAEFSDAASVALYVNRDNVSAQNFYKHIGMSVLREERVMMGKREFVDIVMGKPMANNQAGAA